MQIVPTTFLTLIVALVIVLGGPHRAVIAFLAVTPVGVAAAFNLPALGNSSIIMADMAALLLFGLVVLSYRPANIAGAFRPYQPGFFLAVLLMLAAVTTIVMPRLFAGEVEVFGIARVEGQIGIVTRPLEPTSANITQSFRLVLGCLAFVALATLMRLKPDPRTIVTAMTFATLVHVGLGMADVVTYSTGTTALLEPLRTANYAIVFNQSMAGLKRMVGGFPEASTFGYYSMGVCGFWLIYWLRGGAMRHAGLMFAISAFVLFRSASTSAYVAAAMFAVILLGGAFLRNPTRPVPRRILNLGVVLVIAIILMLAGLVLAYEMMPEIRAFFDRLLFDKLESDSGAERMAWNMRALENFADTFFLGAGLGSVRASNWLVASLSTLGLVGTLAYLAYVTALLRIGRHLPEASPMDSHRFEATVLVHALLAGCLAVFLRAMVVKATPNLGLLFFAMAGMATGLARYLQVSRERALAAQTPVPSKGPAETVPA